MSQQFYSLVIAIAQQAVSDHERNFVFMGKTFVAEFNGYNSGRFTVDGNDCGLRFDEGRVYIG